MDSVEIINPNVAKLLNPRETAILVIDVMDAYCDSNAPLAKFLIENEGATFDYLNIVAERIAHFIHDSRRYQCTTIFIRMLERPEFVSSSIRLKMQMEGIPPIAQRDGEGWNYYKVKPEKDDKEIIKYSYDAFFKTDLDAYLQSKGVKTVIIVGGHASVCVDTTARTAAQLGYNTFVPADLTADPGRKGVSQTPDTVREKLYAINYVMGYMPLSSSILEMWNKSFPEN